MRNSEKLMKWKVQINSRIGEVWVVIKKDTLVERDNYFREKLFHSSSSLTVGYE